MKLSQLRLADVSVATAVKRLYCGVIRTRRNSEEESVAASCCLFVIKAQVLINGTDSLIQPGGATVHQIIENERLK